MNWKRLLISCVITGLLAACTKQTATPALVVTAAPTPTPPPLIPATPANEPSAWFRDAILYEIFAPGFYDSNGDGIGDLQGIVSKLDYVQKLGINTILLTSVLSSTNLLNFEALDFDAIMPSLGTRDDLTELIRQAHNRKMRVMMDLDVTYTSNEFPRFKEAYGKRDSAYSDWYQWTNAAHTMYKSYQGIRTRPLLNHDSTAVQTFLFKAAQNWLRIGIDGFRLGDVSQVPHEFWKPFRQAIQQANASAILIGEAWTNDPQKLAPYFQDEFDALLDTPVYYVLAANPNRNDGGLLNGRSSPDDLTARLKSYNSTAQLVRFAGDHNTNRIASLVSLDASRERMAAALVLTLPGTPLIYYGDEIGMPGSLGTGALGAEYRRAPMDWLKLGRGTGVATWSKGAAQVIKPEDGISVEEQQGTLDSLWSFYRVLLMQRTEHAALRGDNFQVVTSPCRSCYAYLRWDADDFYLAAFNFSTQTQAVTFDLIKTPRPVVGPGEDLTRGGIVGMPSNGRYTLTMSAWDLRLIHWGK